MLTLSSDRYGSNPFVRTTVDAPGNGEPVLVPSESSIISIGLVPAAGATGRVEYTLSPPALVDANDAVWRKWPAGDVTVQTDDSLTAPVTAVRAVSVVGSVTMEVVGA